MEVRVRDGLWIVAVLGIAGSLSAMVKYVLPLWVKQPQIPLLWTVVLAPSLIIALVLWSRLQKL
jgi:hypothetical protein